ncbi:MAG: type II toxin-antitoxin system VapC family toxin [Gemmataceae bacterium]|nr:type II toxin-antitoxin system VapC family toxin [Gemmataceae bacterium]
MYVLDTDILSLVYTGHPKVASRKATVLAGEVAITVITWIEMLQGRFEFLLKAADREQLLRAQSLLIRTKQHLEEIETILPINAAAAVEFERLTQDRRLKKIGRADLLIASIVRAEKATLVTCNLRDFRQVPGLQIENWAD